MIFGLMQICCSPLCTTRAKNVCSYIYSPLDANSCFTCIQINQNINQNCCHSNEYRPNFNPLFFKLNYMLVSLVMLNDNVTSLLSSLSQKILSLFALFFQVISKIHKLEL